MSVWYSFWSLNYVSLVQFLVIELGLVGKVLVIKLYQFDMEYIVHVSKILLEINLLWSITDGSKRMFHKVMLQSKLI